MKIETVDQGIREMLKLGFNKPSAGVHGATVTKSVGGSHTIVRIEDWNGSILFNGIDFSQFLKEIED